ASRPDAEFRPAFSYGWCRLVNRHVERVRREALAARPGFESRLDVDEVPRILHVALGHRIGGERAEVQIAYRVDGVVGDERNRYSVARAAVPHGPADSVQGYRRSRASRRLGAAEVVEPDHHLEPAVIAVGAPRRVVPDVVSIVPGAVAD